MERFKGAVQCAKSHHAPHEIHHAGRNEHNGQRGASGTRLFRQLITRSIRVSEEMLSLRVYDVRRVGRFHGDGAGLPRDSLGLRPRFR